jgi:hypothetical protein
MRSLYPVEADRFCLSADSLPEETFPTHMLVTSSKTASLSETGIEERDD